MAVMDRSNHARNVAPIAPPDRIIAPGPGGRYRGEYQIRVVEFDRAVSRAEARRQLTDDAEYGQWELFRTRLYAGGRRRTWLRRKIIRMP